MSVIFPQNKGQSYLFKKSLLDCNREHQTQYVYFLTDVIFKDLLKPS